MEVSGLHHSPDRFTQRETVPGTHWKGGWISYWEGNQTQAVEPVARRYTDWDIPPQLNKNMRK
jgi:hypothetical protein